LKPALAGLRLIAMCKAAGLVIVLAAACAPIAAPMPFSTLQRAEPLAPGGSSVTFAAGGGSGSGQSVYGGTGAVRANVQNFEVEADAQAIAYDCPSCAQGYQQKHISIGGRIGIKKTVADGIAVIAGAGYAGGAGGHALGWDGGAIVDLGSLFYVSGRVGLAMPIDSSSELANVPTTTYETATVGFRTRGSTALVGELGLGELQTETQAAGVMFFSLGVDLH
jgi:hypothetical protein